MPTPVKDASDKRIERVTVVAATVLATVLSLLFIGVKSLWLDEGSSVFFAEDWSHMWRHLLRGESNMWLYYLLLHFWMKLGDGEAMIRSLSALTTVATVPLVYGLGQRLFGGRAAALAAVLLAANPFLIRYAQEARGYSMLVFFVTLSSYCFIAALEDRASYKWWIAHGLCTALGTATHFFAAQVALTQLAFLLFLGRKNIPWKGVLISVGAATPLLLPQILFQRHEMVRIAWITSPALGDLLRLARRAAGSRPLLLLYGFFCVWALLWRKHPRHDERHSSGGRPYLYTAAWMLVPPTVTFAFSRLIQPIFVDRYLILSVPALVLLGAVGLAHLPRRWMRIAAVALMLYLSSRTLQWWYLDVEKEDWRTVTAFVQSEAQDGDAIACYYYGAERPLGYYLARHPAENEPALLDLTREPVAPTWSSCELNTDLLAQLPSTYPRVWFVLHHDLMIAGTSDRAIILETLNRDYDCVAEYEYPEIRLLLFRTSGPTSTEGQRSKPNQPVDTKDRL